MGPFLGMKVFINDLCVPLHAAIAKYVSGKGYEVVASVPTPSDGKSIGAARTLEAHLFDRASQSFGRQAVTFIVPAAASHFKYTVASSTDPQAVIKLMLRSAATMMVHAQRLLLVACRGIVIVLSLMCVRICSLAAPTP